MDLRSPGFVLVIVGIIFNYQVSGAGISLKFTKEPPSKVDFANTKGVQIECSAQGNSNPIIEWTTSDGTRVTPILGVRDIQSSGRILNFYPFTADKYRIDVHSAVYRCSASNAAGIIKSRDVSVNGVVLQNHDIQVYDTFAIEGNTAVFKCHIPSVLADYVKVTAWIKNDNLLIQPSMDSAFEEKYAITTTGELHIRDVTKGDSASNYRCKTIHKLTGETRDSSNTGQLIVTASHGTVPPRIDDSYSSVTVTKKQTAVLACVAQGNPSPIIKWYRKSSFGQLVPLSNENRVTQTKSLLLIKESHLSDAGNYVCEAVNDMGKVQQDISLIVTEPLTIMIRPELHQAKLNDRVTFKCEVSGYPAASISWMHNGVILTNENKKNELVIDNVKMANKGLYQCMAANEFETVQASAELQLSEIAPYFVEAFNESTIQPGDSISLKCVASGIPLPTIIWKLDETELVNQPRLKLDSKSDRNGRIVSTLKMEKILVENGGLYSCDAKSDAGSFRHYSRINVNGPLGKRPLQEILGIAGKNAKLNCPVYGYPIKRISWEKDNKSLPSNIRQILMKNGSLEIETTNKNTDTGIYKCTAYDETNSGIEAQVKLNIMVPPKIVPFEFQEELLREGMRARLQCVVSEGDLPLKLYWLKDGKQFSNNLGVVVRTLDEFSSILTISSIIPGHNGKYTCVASNRAATVMHTAQLSVNVPPKIVPFNFDGNHFEGSPARVVCGLQEGDAPIQFSWLHDNVPVSSSDRFNIVEVDGLSSILSISKLSSNHKGNYTCIAKNGAGADRHQATLHVNVPPRWIVEPESTSATTGQNVMFHCQVYGFPQPEIVWLQAKNFDRDAERRQLSNSDKIHIYSNGTLLIRDIGSADHGFYFCIASNGIGNELSAVVQLQHHAPPHFKEMMKDVDVAVGKDATIQCLVQGDPPIKITWYRNDKIIQEVHTRNKIQTTNTATDAVSMFTIGKTTKEDQGTYVCFAENKYGTNKASFKLLVRGLPSAPYDLQAVSIESTAFELMWKMTYDPEDPIQKYIIQYKEEEDTWERSITMETANGEPKHSIISNLRPSTNYLFRIYAHNIIGKGQPSSALRVATLEAAPTGPPTNIQVESINTETFKVMWKAPNDKQWNGRLQGFYVGYKEVDTNDPYLFKTLLTPDPSADDLYVQIGGLKQFTKYAVVVLAYNSQGKGPESEPVIVMTSEGAPSLPPTDVRCTILTSQSIHVTWTAPTSDSINGILRGYKVAYKPVSDWFDDLAENFNITLPTALTVTNMEKYTNYSIQVMAMTKAGDGPRSTPVFCKTLDDVPCQPIDIKSIATSEDSVIVSWKPPECPNGILKSYSIYWKIYEESKAALSHSVSSRDNSFEVTGLKNGKRYEFWVTASTMAGEGKPSRTVIQAPIGPTVAAKVVSFDEKIVISWKSDISLTCQAVGLPEPQRRWMLNGQPLDKKSRTIISSDGTLSINGIEEEEGGDYSCHVKNDFGEDKITYTIIVLAPPSSPMTELTSVTSSTIEIQWKVPASKMSRIKGYTINSRRDAGEWKEATVGSEARNYILRNLDCGTRYEIYLTAFNKIGLGQPSEVLIISTNGSVPTAPSKGDLIEESTNSVSLYLNTWKNSGCPIHYYMVEYAVKSSSDWIFVSSNIKPEQRRLVIRDLRASTWYSLRMTAHNSAGSSVAEYTFGTLTNTGGTIAPDLMSDSTTDPVEGILPYLNFYIIVPIACTIIILIAIGGAAWFYIKLKSREDHGGSGGHHMGTLPHNMATLRRGNSSESFAYIQRGTMKGRGHIRDDDLAPYATFQLANQGHMSTMSRKSMMPPPLPPPRVEGFAGDNRNTQYFVQHSAGNVMLQPQTTSGMETTFIFPNLQMDNGFPSGNNFSQGYPHDLINIKTN